ncbi:MAG: aromatic amino acid transaminase [Pseudomonadota bacterium]
MGQGLMFSALPKPKEDALHAVMDRFRRDTRPAKIDLGVGVYRDQTGHSRVMAAIKSAERHLCDREDSKAYLGLRGHEGFLAGMERLLFPSGMPSDVASVQSVGGTGGVRLGLEVARRANEDAKVFIGTPTWPNHLSIAAILGMDVVTYPHFSVDRQALCFDEMMATLGTARPGDIVILHGPCHNPTGADLDAQSWEAVLRLLQETGAVPLFDAAYYGLGGAIEEDVAALQNALTRLPEAILVMSCSKAFSLYRERTGLVFFKAETPAALSKIIGTAENIGRATYSMTPSHGAAAVAHVLDMPELHTSWKSELAIMRKRIEGVRQALAAHASDVPALSSVAHQKGIFSVLPIGSDLVAAMAHDHGIYMPSSGRINIAGFKSADVDIFAQALSSQLVKAA